MSLKIYDILLLMYIYVFCLIYFYFMKILDDVKKIYYLCKWYENIYGKYN